jgi:hypothetical protein
MLDKIDRLLVMVKVKYSPISWHFLSPKCGNKREIYRIRTYVSTRAFCSWDPHLGGEIG